MRFKEYLVESVPDGYQKNLDIMIERGLFLFRKQHVVGNRKVIPIRIPGPYSLTAEIYNCDARKEARRSLTGDNTYLTLSSQWEGFPNRMFSTFATQNAEHTKLFNGSFGVVIPADDVKLFGYTPTDFNDTDGKTSPTKFREKIQFMLVNLKKVISSAGDIINYRVDNEFSKIVRAEIDRLEITKQVKGTSNYSLNFGDKLRSAATFVDWTVAHVDELEKLANNSILETDFVWLIQKMKSELKANNMKSANEIFDKVNPKNYKAKAYTSLSEIPVRASKNEIWFEGKYLFIHVDSTWAPHIGDILKAVRDRK